MNLKLVLASLLFLAFLGVCIAIPTTTASNATITKETGTTKAPEVVKQPTEQEQSTDASVTTTEADADDGDGDGDDDEEVLGEARTPKRAQVRAQEGAQEQEQAGVNNHCDCAVPQPECCYECPNCYEAPDVPCEGEVIVRTLPNIPFDLAFSLAYMHPELVNFVIKRHAHLDYLLLYTDAPTLDPG
ncbi:unnamed protein product [Rodentolepis nana]|uniref:Secreted protein n=1 Tax=Rodentolepis nana TaxID=102285 RepID=A0A0R3TTK8_RODNA|nr:unnamed protein product [Rodentolepis nana]